MYVAQIQVPMSIFFSHVEVEVSPELAGDFHTLSHDLDSPAKVLVVCGLRLKEFDHKNSSITEGAGSLLSSSPKG